MHIRRSYRNQYNNWKILSLGNAGNARVPQSVCYSAFMSFMARGGVGVGELLIKHEVTPYALSCKETMHRVYVAEFYS